MLGMNKLCFMHTIRSSRFCESNINEEMEQCMYDNEHCIMRIIKAEYDKRKGNEKKNMLKTHLSQ